MERIATEAVVLATRSLGETDLIVEFVTRNQGRLSAVAKGARNSRKRYGGRLAKFVCVDLQAHQKPSATLARVDDVQIIESFPGLSEDLDRLAMAEAVMELSARVIVPGPDAAETFDWLLGAWRVLQVGGWNAAEFYYALLQMLMRQGVMASLEQCLRCGEAEVPVTFLAGQGGFVCLSCAPGARVVSSELQASVARVARSCAVPDDLCGKLDEKGAVELRAWVREALRIHAGGDLRSLRMWEEYFRPESGKP